jgi:phosphopantothenoylcysteine decarboxylase/phosphopantothenate--cysteine ligase
MAEPSQILVAIESLLWTGGKRNLVSKEILVSAGGTQEYLDPVRFIGNPSSGKMGVAIALAAHHRGASVTLVHAPLADSLRKELGAIRCIPVVNALEMEGALQENFERSHWLIMAAAVADVMPASYTAHKLAKAELPAALPLTRVPDLVAALGQLKAPDQIVVGFAAQTGDIVPPAVDKLKRKHLDLIVANPVDCPDAGFGVDTNQATIIDRKGTITAIAPCSKLALAHQLLDCIQDYEMARSLGDRDF